MREKVAGLVRVVVRMGSIESLKSRVVFIFVGGYEILFIVN